MSAEAFLLQLIEDLSLIVDRAAGAKSKR